MLSSEYASQMHERARCNLQITMSPVVGDVRRATGIMRTDTCAVCNRQRRQSLCRASPRERDAAKREREERKGERGETERE